MATRRKLESPEEKEAFDGRPLKEKLKEHWNNRDFTVNVVEENLNKTGMSVFWFILLTLEFESQYLLIPAVLEGTNRLIMRIVAAYFFYVMMIYWSACKFNLQSFVRTDMKESAIQEHDAQLLEGWHPCAKCQMDAPPRSHHCKVCQRCVLKRDHHCYFVGSCVGLYNQAFFMVLCFFGSVALLTGMVLQLTYTNEFLPINSKEIVDYIPIINLVLWLMGHISGSIILVLYHFYACFACWSVFTFYLCGQILVISHGKTTHELVKRVKVYNSGTFTQNFVEVFGGLCRLPIMLLWPTRRELSVDGLSWQSYRRR